MDVGFFSSLIVVSKKKKKHLLIAGSRQCVSRLLSLSPAPCRRCVGSSTFLPAPLDLGATFRGEESRGAERLPLKSRAGLETGGAELSLLARSPH